MARPLYAQVNLAALRANLARARAQAPGTQVLAVVKANAYGHGLARVLPALEDADGLALVEPEAAYDLRERRYTRRILMLEGFFAERELPEFAQRRLATVVHDMEQVRMLETAVLPRPLEVFVKVNTGMNRLGFRPSEVAAACTRLSSSPSVAALRLMMHFARADEDDGIAEPMKVFDGACRGLPYPRSLANSAGIFRFPEVGGDIVRPGIMLYGATPFAYDTADMLGLKPVMTLRSTLVGVQELKANESVGYGAAYTASRPHRVGVIACGYADGYPRHAPNGTPVLVCGRKVRMAGRPSMDMVTVDLTDVPEARVGSPVVLWGEGLPVDDVASAAATVGYELLCAVAPRVPFVTSEVGSVDLEL
ncbi:MAG: alanine racemase [Betaproteobacteria bacterium]|nr:alanine racemase [Betaproteobacteria bacterium]MCC7216719.1 alanine racemase [Burkholderiales bacterium]